MGMSIIDTNPGSSGCNSIMRTNLAFAVDVIKDLLHWQRPSSAAEGLLELSGNLM
jgi:hypothetical protein